MVEEGAVVGMPCQNIFLWISFSLSVDFFGQQSGNTATGSDVPCWTVPKAACENTTGSVEVICGGTCSGKAAEAERSFMMDPWAIVNSRRDKEFW